MQVLVGEQWLGRIMPDGRVGRPLADDGPTLEVLRRIGVDPAAAAHEYGATNGVCSYCNTELTDAGSVEVGYGPVCAKRYGLPHQPRGSQIGKVA